METQTTDNLQHSADVPLCGSETESYPLAHLLVAGCCCKHQHDMRPKTYGCDGNAPPLLIRASVVVWLQGFQQLTLVAAVVLPVGTAMWWLQLGMDQCCTALTRWKNVNAPVPVSGVALFYCAFFFHLPDPPACSRLCTPPHVDVEYRLEQSPGIGLARSPSFYYWTAMQVGGSMSSLRQVQAGRPYQLPPPVSGIPPSAQETLTSWRQNITQAAALAAAEKAAAATRNAAAAAARASSNKGVDGAEPPAAAAAAASLAGQGTVLSGTTRAYMGVSPSLVEELCHLAGVSPAAEPDTLAPQAWQDLHQAWLTWLDRLHSKKFTASTCPATGKFSVIGSYPEQHESVHDTVEGYYRSLQAGEVYAGLHQRLSTAVRQALKKARGRAKSFEQQLAAADDAAAVQRRADIIVANMYR